MKPFNFEGIAALAVTLSKAPNCKSGAEAIRLARRVNGYPPVGKVNDTIRAFLRCAPEFREKFGPAVGFHEETSLV